LPSSFSPYFRNDFDTLWKRVRWQKRRRCYQFIGEFSLSESVKSFSLCKKRLSDLWARPGQREEEEEEEEGEELGEGATGALGDEVRVADGLELKGKEVSFLRILTFPT